MIRIRAIINLVYDILSIPAMIIPLRVLTELDRFRNRCYSRIISRSLSECGSNFSIHYPAHIIGACYMRIGSNFSAFGRNRIEAIDVHNGINFHPVINIGHNVSINYNCHIACIEQIDIGDNVLMGSNIYITDHSHGFPDSISIKFHPGERVLRTKGPVIIEEDVWLGENVTILPGVRIGKGSIIGAGSVVTKHIPPYVVAVGIPAKVISKLSG